jgi:hypothetical protein
MQIYKMYNTTLLKILPASGKLGFINLAKYHTILLPTTKLKTQYIEKEKIFGKIIGIKDLAQVGLKYLC